MRQRTVLEQALIFSVLAACVALCFSSLRSQSASFTNVLADEHSWREADTYSIAQNFFHDGPDFFHPKIDMTDGRSGVMAMEAPLLPWVSHWLMYVFGDGPVSMRYVIWILFFGGVLSLGSLAPREERALFPAALFCVAVCSPAGLFESRQVQPDPAMAGCLMIAAGCFVRSHRSRKRLWFVLGMVAYVSAVMIKVPALVAGPAMWWLALPRSVRIERGRALSRTVTFAVPLILAFGWLKWGQHLTAKYNDGQFYFATSIGVGEAREDLLNRGLLTHIFRDLLPNYYLHWSFFPLLLLGFVRAAERPQQRVAIGMAIWALTSFLFLGAVGRRLQSHWYYALVACPPLIYFAGIGVSTMLAAAVSRWPRYRVASILAFGSALLLGSEHFPFFEARSPIATFATLGGRSWQNETGFTILTGTLVLGAIVGSVTNTILNGAGAPSESLFRSTASGAARLARFGFCVAALAVTFPRAARDANYSLAVSAHLDNVQNLALLRAGTAALTDRFSTRRDQFVISGSNPAYLHWANRRGFVHPLEAIARNGPAFYAKRNARFAFIFAHDGPVPASFQGTPVLGSNAQGVLLCIDPSGCARRTPQ